MTNKKILQLKRIIELNNINRLSLRYDYDLPDLKRLDIIDARNIRWTRLYLDLIKVELKRRAKTKTTLSQELNKLRNGKSNSQ